MIKIIQTQITIMNQLVNKNIPLLALLRITKKKNKKNNLTQSFSLAFILSYLDINIPDQASSLTHFSFSVFLLTLVALLCFINVLGFLTAYIIIQKGNYENKYPKFKKIINYYKKSTLFYVIIEVLICLCCLLLLLFFSILYV